MCTLTFIPKGNNDFILTSNRDEASNRPTRSPDFYIDNHVKLLYPKDEKAGGTWIGVSEKSRLVSLLNGGFMAHEHGGTYRLSRGVVVKDVLCATDFLNTIETYNLIGVEPFTMVILDWENDLQLYQLVWDGNTKHFDQLPMEARIWSSSSLYTESMKSLRETWFKNFKENHDASAENWLKFHTTTEKDNLDFGLLMDRKIVKTTSITQIEKTNQLLKMWYLNLQNQETVEQEMLFSN
ncbi:NRDE family protein [Bizionia myxarmorum]|uniref:NRDE family protein n=1 Tax=Bizionia myxarmorum TaxID=291186 RepID=A0A5D0RC49_9FLAO|nr:NRDE family protein [Bizionia myxarmorum]TYB79250.1 NRDE family protein [Bizionia myxarmorum]